MKLLTVGPKDIFKFPTVKDFAEAFELGPNDLVVSIEMIYDKFLKPYLNGANVLLVDKYGNQEPTDVMIDEIIADAGKFDYDRIVAIGGGAVMDMSKVVAVAGGASIDDVIDHLPDFKRKVGLVLIPTTCGTGSEVTEIAAINRTRLGCKAGIAGPEMFADHAVLIPELLYGLPDHVFMTSSLDALVHSVESTLSPNSTPYTKLFGYEAMKTIINGYKAIVEAGEPGSAERRAKRNELMDDFLIASDYAGISFDTGGCAAVHALSYQLGGKYHVPHGESNYAMFTGVLRNYMEIKSDGEIAKLNKVIADVLGCDVADVYDELENLINQLLPKKALHEYGVTREDLPEFTERVMTTQERLMKNCFVPLDADRVRKIFEELY
ncbi:MULTISPECIES: 4-hydroxybutyrate dehydrogenase [Bifidobacterium]|uniref:4-hydroxybutyrate dehydrogenase n=2 Tax=Bifidobacterium TaxID=1678 RepID=A0A430F9B5_9BIFI|nr:MULTISPECIES: 4-hydroxybutyrate dehydrogenase [Bifidobacterium]MBT1178007.1 4-hydroxybutyrate dehydrogenase [Bifidobacterium callimiconis]OXN01101.1 4-hydroxybutyrate dehydrogenase [Bifidobacterium vansinderenii]RSX49426.1 4-hydroxybutyrate dehydrogenase [Bifidobacterium callimiconis]